MTGAVDILLAGIVKSFAGQPVLRGVDLAVPAGTLTTVLGPSGCGKTTLLRILAGFEDPDAGVVRIAQQSMFEARNSVPAHRRRVGLMPQEGALFAHLSVAGNVGFGLSRAGRSNSRAVIDEWLEIVGLSGLADARPHELSGGQQQRVALARALAARPRVLLLDEPFAALDAGLRVRVREDITAILRQTGTTAILVTHDQSEALSLSDSVAVLLAGSVAQNSPPDQLYDRPETLQVARFIGETVELTGTVHDGVGHTVLGSHPLRNLAPDGPAILVARPEQLRIGASADPAGTVRHRRFYGAHAVLHVVLGDGTEIALHGAPEQLPAAGERVGVGISGSLLAYPAG